MPLNGDEPNTDASSTESIAASVIAEIENDDAGSDAGDVSTSTDTAAKPAEGEVKPDAAKKADVKPAEAKKADEKKVEEDDDDFDKVPAEIDDPNPKNKGKKIANRLPHERVKKMVEKARTKARAEAEAEWTTKHTPVQERVQTLETYLTELNTLAASDPDKFLAELAVNLPIYKEYTRAVKAAAKEAAAAEEQEPQPDLADGGYSIAQAKKLVQFYADKNAAELRKEIAPIAEKVKTREKAEADAIAEEEARAATAKRVETKLETAKKSWPGYTDHEKEIQDVYLADKTLSLEDAYIKVVVAKLQTAARDARSLAIEDLKNTPVDTSVARGDTEKVTEAGKTKTTEEIAREVIRAAEAAGL